MATIRSLTDRGDALIYDGLVYSKRPNQPTLGVVTTGGEYTKDNIEGVTFVLDDSGVVEGPNHRIWTPGEWGIARWLEANSFVPDSATVLLAHFDGDNESTTMVDGTSRHTLTAHGNAQISTAQAKFGQSLLLDGTGDFVKTANSDDFRFGTGDFAIELWARWAVANKDMAFVGNANLWSGSVRGFAFWWNNVSKKIFFNCAHAPGVWGVEASFSFTPTIETWYHIALSRAGGSLRCFVDGVQIGSTVSANVDTEGSATISEYLHIGTELDPTRYDFNGNIDELRISKGVARYTANFTPPTAPHDDPRTLTAPANGIARVWHEEAGTEPFRILVNSTEVYVSEGNITLENAIPIALAYDDELVVAVGSTPVRVAYLPDTYP